VTRADSAIARAFGLALRRPAAGPTGAATHGPPGNGWGAALTATQRCCALRVRNGASSTGFTAGSTLGGGSWELRPSSERTLKGNKAQEGPDRVRIGNGAVLITAPTTEQGPEADATVCDHTSIEPATVRRRVAPQRHANGRRATAAVTRNGCRRGSSFEGYDVRRGDLATAPARPHRRCLVGTSTKRGEPHDR